MDFTRLADDTNLFVMLLVNIAATHSTAGMLFLGPKGSHWPQMEQIQNYQNLIWKSPRFIPFGANLTRFGPKSEISIQLPHFFYLSLLKQSAEEITHKNSTFFFKRYCYMKL